MKRASSCLLVLTLSLSTAPAAAADEEAALAEALFIDARELMKSGDHPAACKKFKASQKLDPQNGTLLNLGDCYLAVGRTASAWAAFRALAPLARRAGQEGRANYAEQRVDELTPKLSRLRLEVKGPVTGQTVTVGEQSLARAAWSTSLPVDPGEVRLVAAAAGHIPWSTTVAVSGPGIVHLVVPQLKPVQVAPSAPEQAAPPPVPTPTPEPGPPVMTSSGYWPVAITGYAIAGAALVIGGVTGILALKQGDDLACPMGACPPEELDELDEATLLANVSNVSFGVAGAGALLGIVTTILAVQDEVPAAGFSAGFTASGPWVSYASPF